MVTLHRYPTSYWVMVPEFQCIEVSGGSGVLGFYSIEVLRNMASVFPGTWESRSLDFDPDWYKACPVPLVAGYRDALL